MEDTSQVGKTDSTLFWGALLITPVVWAFLLVVAALTFKPQWMLVVVVALILSFSNIVGYWKCRRDAKKQTQEAAQSIMSQGAMAAFTKGPGMVSSLFGSSGSTEVNQSERL